MSAGFTVLGGKDITFTNSTSFTGDASGRIQLYNNSLYLQYNTSIIFRESTGSTDVANINSSGDFTSIGDMQFRRGTFTQSTGTAPFSVSSTTLVNNLNADLLDGIPASSFVRSDANDTVANNLSFTSNTTPITTNSIKFNNSEMTSSYYTEQLEYLHLTKTSMVIVHMVRSHRARANLHHKRWWSCNQERRWMGCSSFLTKHPLVRR